MDYIEQTSAGIFDDADEVIKEVAEEHGEITIATKATDNSKEVEAGDSTQKLTDIGLRPKTHTEPDVDDSKKASEGAKYTREQAFRASVGEVELETPGQFKQAEATKERLKEIEQVNNEMERIGTARRYVPGKSDVPAGATSFEDEFGTYYYKDLGVDIRPSDVAEWAEKEHFASLDADEKVLKTIELMNELEAHALVDAKSEDDVVNWFKRHMVQRVDDPRGEDVFTNEFIRSVANTVARTQGLTEKRRVYIDDPSEAPEDLNVQEGQQGGYYYETNEGGNESSGAATEAPADGASDDVLAGDFDERVVDEIRDRDEEPEETMEMLVDETSLTEGDVLELVSGDLYPSPESREELEEALEIDLTESDDDLEDIPENFTETHGVDGERVDPSEGPPE